MSELAFEKQHKAAALRTLLLTGLLHGLLLHGRLGLLGHAHGVVPGRPLRLRRAIRRHHLRRIRLTPGHARGRRPPGAPGIAARRAVRLRRVVRLPCESVRGGCVELGASSGGRQRTGMPVFTIAGSMCPDQFGCDTEPAARQPQASSRGRSALGGAPVRGPVGPGCRCPGS